MRVLIVDRGLERTSVAAARALVSGGWTVGAGSESPNVAATSNAVSAWHHVAHTEQCDDAFLESLAGVVSQHRYDAAFMVSEPMVAAVSANRERLPFPVGYGPHAGVSLASDKDRLREAAARAGLAVPKTVTVTATSAGGLEAPMIVKPASPAASPLPAVFCTSTDAALVQAAQIEASGGAAIGQEWLRGSLMALSAVSGPDGIVSICQQVAVHTWPQPIGITARGVTVPVDGPLRERVEALLAELEWQGLAQLQFLVPADGVPRLLDFNPRYYGSMALAISAGANHPDTWARIATGRPTTPQVGRPGAIYQWFTRDLRASAASPDRGREVLRALAIGPTAAHSLWNFGDPWTAPRHLSGQLTRAVRRRAGVEPFQTRLSGRTVGDAGRNAALHGVPATPAVIRALRTRPVPPRPQRIVQRMLMKAGRLSYEDAWLAPLQSAFQQLEPAQRPDGLRLLVRVDEFPYYSGFDSPKSGREASERFHAVMAEEGVPHLMSVVPQWTHAALDPEATGGRALDDGDVALIDQMRRDGVTFAQHGHTHRTRYVDPRQQSELCGLSPELLGETLDAGRRKLAEVGVHPRILVPPFNRFDADQWPVLEQRYDVVTGGPESVALMGLHGGPEWRGDCVYLPCYAPLYESAASILPAVETLIDRGVVGWVPIVLHLGWEIDDDFAALRRLARRIASMTASWDDLLARVDLSR